MKKLLFTLIIGCVTLCAYSQCWVQAPCTNEVNFTGTLSNKNYSGSTCFSGAGAIKNSVNVNNWDFISYTGAIQVDGPLNLNNKVNAYANGSIQFDQVHFTGGDTLFIDGAVTISKIVSNNSEVGKRNVIMLSSTSALLVGGKPYKAGDVIITPGNSKNEVDVRGCDGGSTLPVHISDFAINRGILYWNIGVEDNIKGFVVQGSDDAQKWVDIDTVRAEGTSYSYTLHHSHMASLGLVVLILIGLLILSKKFKVGAIALAFISCSLISCSKEAPVKDSSYKYYRLKVLNSDGTAEFSSVVHE